MGLETPRETDPGCNINHTPQRGNQFTGCQSLVWKVLEGGELLKSAFAIASLKHVTGGVAL